MPRERRLLSALSHPNHNRVVVLSGGAGTRGLPAELAAIGYEAIEVADSFAAVCEVLAREVDLVVASADHRDAVPLLGLLRRHPVTEAVGVVFLDPGGSREHRIGLFRAGADDVLPTGLDPEELDVRLQAHIRARAAAAHAASELASVRALLDALDDALLLVDEVGTVTYANRPARRLLNLNPDVLRLLNLPRILDAFGVPATVIARLLSADPGVVEEAEVSVGGTRRQLRLRVEQVADPATNRRHRAVRVQDLAAVRELPSQVPGRPSPQTRDAVGRLRRAEGQLARLAERPVDLHERVLDLAAELAALRNQLEGGLEAGLGEAGAVDGNRPGVVATHP